MSIGSSTAKRGYKHEQLFTDLINNNTNFKQGFIDYINEYCDLPYVVIPDKLYARNVQGTEKSDVNVYYDGIHHIGCSLKSAEANFNQLDRRWLRDWVNILNMPENIANALQEGLDSMRLKEPNCKLVLDKYSHIIVNYFSDPQVKNILYSQLFTRNDMNLKLLVCYDNQNNRWHFSKIEDVISYLTKQPTSISNRGVLKFGNCLSLQRKGGDGNVTNPPKTSPNHPSNNLQFKIKPISLLEYIPNVTLSPTK